MPNTFTFAQPLEEEAESFLTRFFATHQFGSFFQAVQNEMFLHCWMGQG